MANDADYTKFSPTELAAAARDVTLVVKTVPNAYGFTQDDLDAMNDGNADIKGAMEQLTLARNTLKSKTEAKETVRKGLASSLSGLYRRASADPSITDEMLIAIGFPPRRTGGVRPTALPAPTGLTAESFSDSTVKLKWDRNGNRRGTIFVVESSADGFSYTMIDSMTRCNTLLTGYAPGVQAWFRVTAKSAGLVSPASPSVSVYAPTAAAKPLLRVA